MRRLPSEIKLANLSELMALSQAKGLSELRLRSEPRSLSERRPPSAI